MMVELLTIAQAQLAEQLTKEECDYLTLQTDGTTKYGQHFSTFDIATDDTVYHLGLCHISSGSAQSTLDVFTEILDDLNIVSKELGFRSKFYLKSKIQCPIEKIFQDLQKRCTTRGCFWVG